MKVLSDDEVTQVSGGLPWMTPAMLALADTGSLGPLAWSFGIGYGIGTLIYNYYGQ